MPAILDAPALVPAADSLSSNGARLHEPPAAEEVAYDPQALVVNFAPAIPLTEEQFSIFVKSTKTSASSGTQTERLFYRSGWRRKRQ